MYPSHKFPQQYEHMVFSRWLRSLRHGNPLFKKVKSEAYFKNYHKYLENLMAKPDSQIRFAVLSDDHDVVLGFSVKREDVLDYVHVHTSYRNLGIAKSLVPAEITAFTHYTKMGGEIWQSKDKYKKIEFNPYA